MAWFVEKVTQAEEAYDEAGQQVDEASVGLNTVSEAPIPEGGEALDDTLTSLEHSYNVADTVGSDVDQQLATIVDNLTKNRLPGEKLVELKQLTLQMELGMVQVHEMIVHRNGQ